MRSIFTVVSLLLALAIVGVLAKKQLTSLLTVVPSAESTTASQERTPQSPKEVQQQFKQALDAAVQPARREAEEK